MKTRTFLIFILCIVLLTAAVLAFTRQPATVWDHAAEANGMNFAMLLTDLEKAFEEPGMDPAVIEKDLEAIREVDPRDYEIAKSIAEHWQKV